MEPIVNPWLIYLVSIVEHLRNFFNAITFVVCALDTLIVMGTFIESDDAIAVFYNREEKNIISHAKTYTWLFNNERNFLWNC